ncbi:MAG: 16S rRNA (adenine(1518)-N(6)/adenine(1519)-N(6))-dimethyltransferase RsmA [Alphaproteobacteria bacterium]|nr:16S rRNA (adenine(1518)-N(6)/adenine(1519)-N(6))-dimethyltransferase RsmA [Alphaproteobacteria bacterium]
MDGLSAKNIFDTFLNRADKKFGQNFLFDEKINQKIVSVAGDLKGKVVAEIGPGPGGLTLEILKQNIKKLYVIEFESRVAEVWKTLQPQFNEKLEVIECDALKFDLKSVAPDVVISNLPYNISTELLLKWLPNFHLCERYVLMFQKEVAGRLCATPKTKEYGRLSVLTQWKAKVSKAFDLDPGSFFPAPKVKSTVIKFEPFKKENVSGADYFAEFSELLTAVFSHRRKMASKFLQKFFVEPEKVLISIGYGPKVRAEEISVPDYIRLFENYFLSNKAKAKS